METTPAGSDEKLCNEGLEFRAQMQGSAHTGYVIYHFLLDLSPWLQIIILDMMVNPGLVPCMKNKAVTIILIMSI